MSKPGQPRILQGLVDVPASEATLLLEAGYLLMELGRAKAAQDLLGGVCDLLPSSDVARVALGNCHFARGHFKQALKCHQDALRTHDDSALALAHMGEALAFLGRRDEAVAALQKAVAMEPDGLPAGFATALLQAIDEGNL